MPELALAGIARSGLGLAQVSSQGPNRLINFAEFVVQCRRALMQSLYDVQDPLRVYEISDHQYVAVMV